MKCNYAKIAGLVLLLVSFILQPFQSAIATTSILEPVNSISLPGVIKDIDDDGNYIYVITRMNSGLQVIDVSDISNASIVSSYELPFQTNYEGVIGYNNHAYIRSSKELTIFDISNPSNITLISDYKYQYSTLGSMLIENNLAFLATPQQSFLVLDISDPTNITPKGSMQLEVHQSKDIAKVDNFVVLPNDQILNIINISKPSTPSEIARFESKASIISIEADRKYVYATVLAGKSMVNISTHRITTALLKILDISNIMRPTEISSTVIGNGSGYPEGIAVDNYYVYIADTKSGLIVYDAIDPTEPVEIARSQIAFKARKIIVNGGYVYVSEEQSDKNFTNKLHIFKTINDRLLPDLSVLDNRLYADRSLLRVDDLVQIKATIENNGLGTSPPSDAVLKLEDGVEIGQIQIPSLAVNESFSFNRNITDLPPGQHTITLYIDLDDEIKEIKEDNNEASIQLQVMVISLTTPSFSLSWLQIMLAAIIFTFFHVRRHTPK